ncbi:hypothetical protein [Alloprevotella tannerae]|uniref:hypothetical protein n=1 Tax=Alloprevotella tannerae TaxID=76122 RepID=UPI003C6EFDAA
MREKIKIKWMAAYEKNTIFVENNSWTMKFLSCLILMLLFTTSCDNGVKREEKPQALCIDMQNGEKIYLSPDSVVQFERTAFLVPKVSDEEKANAVILGYGGKLLPVKPTKTWFLAEFLQPIPQLGIEAHKKYYAQLRHCCQTFPFNSDYILNPVIDTPYHMGFAPEYPLHNMYSSNRVCSITSSSTTHYCYLIYLGFDEQKRKMDTYFPCHPDSLIWKFNVKHIN